MHRRQLVPVVPATFGFPSSRIRRKRAAGAAILLALAAAALPTIPAASSRAFADLDVTVLHGDRVTARIDPVSEVERFTIPCAEGTLVTATVVATKVPPAKTAAPVRVRLLDDAGGTLSTAGRDGPVAADATGPRVAFKKVVAPTSGGVVVEATAPEGTAAALPYTLVVSLKPKTTWRTPAVAVSAAQPGLFSFAAPAGATVRFKVKAQAGVAPTFGRVLENSAATGADFTGVAPKDAVFVAPAAGSFQLEVFGATDGFADISAKVVVPKSRARKIDVTAFADTSDAVLQTLDGTSPADIAPDSEGLDGLRLEIPAGVFPAGTILAVSPAATLAPSGAFTPAGPAITITASSPFAKGATVTLTLPFNASAANGNAASVAVTVRDDAGNVSETTSGLNVDLNAGRVSFPASHFSTYQAVVVATPGIISTFAGNGGLTTSGDEGPATAAGLPSPLGVTVSPTGVVYISYQHGIRRVDSLGVIHAVAGSDASGFGGDGGPASGALLSFPTGVLFDPDGNLVVCDRNNHRVRKIDASGTITTIVGDGTAGFAGDGSAATAARVNLPQTACYDAAGNLYIADSFNHRIRKVDTSGIITTVAGSSSAGNGGDGGPATSAQLFIPIGVAVNAAGDIFIADYGNFRIRRVAASDGVISTVAGDGTSGLSGDGGPASAARLNLVGALTIDIDDSLLLLDAGNNAVRRITAAGTIERVAGTGAGGFAGDGGLAVDAVLNFPHGIAVDRVGRIYVCDLNNQRVRRIDP